MSKFCKGSIIFISGAFLYATNAFAYQEYSSPAWKWILYGGNSGSFDTPEAVVAAWNAKQNAQLQAAHVNCGQTSVNIYDASFTPGLPGTFLNGQFTWLNTNSGKNYSYVNSCYIDGVKYRDSSMTSTPITTGGISIVANTFCPYPTGAAGPTTAPVPDRVAVPGGTVPNYLMWCVRNVPDLSCKKSGGGKYGNPIDSINGSKTELVVDYENPDGLLTVSRTYASTSAGWQWRHGGSLADFSGRSSASYRDDDDFVGIVNLLPPGLYDPGNAPAYVPTAVNVPLIATQPPQDRKEVWLKNSQGARIPYIENVDHSFSSTVPQVDVLRVFSDTDPTKRWITTSTEKGFTIYDDRGAIQAVYRQDGQIQKYDRTATSLTVSTPYSGRKLVYSMVGAGNDGRYNEILLPNGDKLRYDTETALVNSVTYQDGSSRIYKYGEPDMIGTSSSQPSWLTGIVDENNIRFATFKYDGVRPISTEHASGVEKYTFNYYDGATGVTPPYSGSPGSPQITVNWETGPDGERRFTSKTQPAGAGCNASTSKVSYYTDGQTMYQDDFIGHRTCFAYTSSTDGLANMEKVRVEGLPNTATCAGVLTDGASLPVTNGTQSRKISTQWHPQWALKTKQAEPNLLTTWVDNGQPDPFNGNQTASCVTNTFGGPATLPDGSPTAVLCRKVEQRTTDDTGALGFGATLDTSDPDATMARQWKYSYTEYGQVLTSKGPMSLDEVSTPGQLVTYTYFPDTSFTGTVPNEVGHTKGDLQTMSVKVSDTASLVTNYLQYDRSGHLLQMRDANDLLTTMSYAPRGWLTSVNQGGLLTQYEYWPTGLLKKATQPDGSYLYYKYDDAHRLTDVGDKVDTAGNFTGNWVHYTLDNAGNRTSEDVKDSGGNLTRNITRTYDALNRLQAVKGLTQ